MANAKGVYRSWYVYVVVAVSQILKEIWEARLCACSACLLEQIANRFSPPLIKVPTF
jgi:hypothetical protein